MAPIDTFGYHVIYRQFYSFFFYNACIFSLGLQMTLTFKVSTDILPFCFGLLLLFMLFPWNL